MKKTVFSTAVLALSLGVIHADLQDMSVSIRGSFWDNELQPNTTEGSGEVPPPVSNSTECFACKLDDECPQPEFSIAIYPPIAGCCGTKTCFNYESEHIFESTKTCMFSSESGRMN
jgi:hypothetical protein